MTISELLKPTTRNGFSSRKRPVWSRQSKSVWCESGLWSGCFKTFTVFIYLSFYLLFWIIALLHEPVHLMLHWILLWPGRVIDVLLESFWWASHSCKGLPLFQVYLIMVNGYHPGLVSDRALEMALTRQIAVSEIVAWLLLFEILLHIDRQVLFKWSPDSTVLTLIRPGCGYRNLKYIFKTLFHVCCSCTWFLNLC